MVQNFCYDILIYTVLVFDNIWQKSKHSADQNTTNKGSVPLFCKYLCLCRQKTGESFKTEKEFS